jgi:hypothetical protein
VIYCVPVGTTPAVFAGVLRGVVISGCSRVGRSYDWRYDVDSACY